MVSVSYDDSSTLRSSLIMAKGLFTAYPHEENWGIAHRILIPAFGPISIRGMFDGMSDIVSQLVTKVRPSIQIIEI